MRSRYKIIVPNEAHFLTTTIVQWIPVFYGEEACSIITGALTYCRAHLGLRVYAYVVMENHVHLVAEATALDRVMQRFKRHTAREIIRLCERMGRAWTLNQFAYYRGKSRAMSTHQVWQEGYHPKCVDDQDAFWQKIAYIHDNPVRRGHVDAPEHWRYSSARNYLGGGLPVMAIDDIEERS
jgi:REP element-mobilizing transposase RayT